MFIQFHTDQACHGTKNVRRRLQYGLQMYSVIVIGTVYLFLQWVRQQTMLWLLHSFIRKASAMEFTPSLSNFGMRIRTNPCQVQCFWV